MKIRTMAALAATAAMLAACSKAPDTTEATAAAPAEEHAAPAAPPPAFARKASPAGAAVTIDVPKDGSIVTSPVHVVFQLQGMTVAPVDAPVANGGHHHLLIDTDLADPGMPVPTDDKHKHFGKGQTETDIELTPGEHTLQLVLADELHVPFDPMVASPKIKIVVK